jgi:OFA family oxalate/formate antiporter-like MFS transporter
MIDSPSTRRIVSRHILALGAGVLMNMAFGSLYAWSVFIPSLEQEFTILRADVSVVFSLAVISFTAGNFFVPFFFGRLPTALLPLLSAGLAGAGLALAGMGSGYQTIIVGFGALFGFGCGIAYNTSLQTAQFALPNKPGLANGIVISSFALGSILAAHLLSDSIAVTGVRATFWVLALSVFGVGLVSVVLVALSGIKLPRQDRTGGPSENRRVLGISWVGFFLGAFAGTMAIGHAAAIVLHFGGPATLAVTGVAVLGIGNAAGRLFSGWLSDLISVRSVAGLAHLTSAIGLVVVLGNPSGEGAVVTLVMAGIAYGMTASVYPSAVSIFMGRASCGRNFGILLTAWGAAGLAGPFIGGYSFDMTSDYRVALEFAAVASVLGLFNAMRLPRQNPTN